MIRNNSNNKMGDGTHDTMQSNTGKAGTIVHALLKKFPSTWYNIVPILYYYNISTIAMEQTIDPSQLDVAQIT